MDNANAQVVIREERVLLIDEQRDDESLGDDDEFLTNGSSKTPDISPPRRSVVISCFGSFLIGLVLLGIVYNLSKSKGPNQVDLSDLRGDACDVFCHGELLQTMGLSGLFNASKDFVDMSLLAEPDVVLAAFRALPDVSQANLAAFLRKYFVPAGDDLIPVIPADFMTEPPMIGSIKDDLLRSYATRVNSFWKKLSYRPSDDVNVNPMRHTLLRTRHPIFIIPGGRFRETYYWDTFFIVRGLISVDMHDTAQRLVENLLDHAEDNQGVVPNGSRRYYLTRSQPPMLTLMVKDVFESLIERSDHQKAMNFLHYALGILDSEYSWWMKVGAHAILVTLPDKRSHVLNRESTVPRPEMFDHDFLVARTLPNNGTEQYFSNVAATAESGWDFSNRWVTSEDKTVTMNILPVDLNVLLCQAEKTLASLHSIAGRHRDSDFYKDAHAKRVEAMIEVFWKDDDAEFLDYNFVAQTHGQVGMSSNYFPLWGGCLQGHSRTDEIESKLITSFASHGTLQPGGISSSALPVMSNLYQWNWPNSWAPVQHILFEGLSQQKTKPEAQKLAREIARRWIQTTFLAEKRTGFMYEKYDATKIGTAGEGGEYIEQIGFGWTNGVVLAFLKATSDHQFAVDAAALEACAANNFVDCQVIV